MNNNIRSFRWVLAAFGIALVSSLSLAKKDPYIFKFGMMSPQVVPLGSFGKLGHVRLLCRIGEVDRE